MDYKMRPDDVVGTVRHLLSLARNVRHYEEALSHATGERFNLFDILHVGHYEVRTHSPMLAELLNPKGSHGQGAVFLQMFLGEVKIRDFDAETAKVETEVSIGALGRLDIKITDRNHRRVIIENKIYAGLRENQLEDYNQHDPQANLLFLTLDGEEPPPTNNAKWQPVAYGKEIVAWLERCRKEAVAAPGVRETITQYINLIKALTGQNTNSRMQAQITASILQNPETLDAYFTLVRSKDNVITEVLKRLKVQCDEIGKELGLKADFDEIGEKYRTFGFHDGQMDKQKLWIAFQFAPNSFRNLQFGIARREEVDRTRTPIAERFERIFGPCNFNSWWPAMQVWRGREDWENGETLRDIYFGSFKVELREKVKQLAELLRELNG